MKHNIVLITVDCLRYDRCNFNGYLRNTTTPEIDQLTSESLLFDTALATGPWTAESFPGILAGLRSSDCTYHEKISWKAIPEERPTLASHLAEHGYKTSAVVTNPNLSSVRNFDQGFHRYRNLRLESEGEDDVDVDRQFGGDLVSKLGDYLPFLRLDRVESKMKNRTRTLDPYALAYILYRLSETGDWPTVRANAVVDEFKAELRELSADEPFFAWTHLMDLHAPIHPNSTRTSSGGIRGYIEHFLADANRISDLESERYHTIYDQALRYVSRHVGEIIETLKDQQVWDDTILVFTSDHGEALYDRALYGHDQNYLFDDVLRVPLVVRVPETRCRRFDQPFSLGWLGELLSELVEIPAPDFPMSGGKGDYLSDGDGDGRPVISDSSSEQGNTVSIRTVTDGQELKLVKHFYTHETTPRYFDFIGDPTGLYDMDADPTEQRPVGLEHAPTALRNRLDELETDPQELLKVGDAIDDEVLDRLRNMGYKT